LCYPSLPFINQDNERKHIEADYKVYDGRNFYFLINFRPKDKNIFLYLE